MKYKLSIIGLVVVLLVALAGFADTPTKEETADSSVDYLGLASLLIKDRHFVRAQMVLEDVDLEQGTVDKAQFYMLVGVVEMSLHHYPQALDAFEKSVGAGQKDKMVYVFAAQVCYKLELYDKTTAYLNSAGDAATKLPAIYMLKANAYWKQKQMDLAYDALSDGIKKYPQQKDFRRSRVMVLVESGLFQQAIVEGQQFLAAGYAAAEDYTAISEAFLSGGAHDEAILILEAARLLYPEESRLTVQLARAYMKANLELISARLFHLASYEEEKFSVEAAELYRRQGQFLQALRRNEKVVDQKVKIRQRLGILIDMARFEEAVTLGPRLHRLGLLREDALRYGLAYAYFKTGDFSTAEKHLSQLKDPIYFNKAMGLRQAIAQCKASGWQCQ